MAALLLLDACGGGGGLPPADAPAVRASLLKSATYSAGATENLTLQDGYAFIALGEAGFITVDVRDPLNPFLATVRQDKTDDLAVCGGRLYTIDYNDYPGRSTLRVYNVSDPKSPLEGGKIEVEIGGAGGMVCKGSKVFVAGGARGLQVIDASNPSKPRLVAQVLPADVPISGSGEQTFTPGPPAVAFYEIALQENSLLLVAEIGGVELGPETGRFGVRSFSIEGVSGAVDAHNPSETYPDGTPVVNAHDLFIPYSDTVNYPTVINDYPMNYPVEAAVDGDDIYVASSFILGSEGRRLAVFEKGDADSGGGRLLKSMSFWPDALEDKPDEEACLAECRTYCEAPCAQCETCQSCKICSSCDQICQLCASTDNQSICEQCDSCRSQCSPGEADQACAACEVSEQCSACSDGRDCERRAACAECDGCDAICTSSCRSENPFLPKIAPGEISNLDVLDGVLALADGDLHLIDVSNPADPQFITTVRTPGTALAVALERVSDELLYAFVADGDSGLKVVSIDRSAHGYVQARPAAYGVPGAGAVAVAPSFNTASPIYGLDLTAAGGALGAGRLLVASTSNFGAAPLETEGGGTWPEGSILSLGLPENGSPLELDKIIQKCQENCAGYCEYSCPPGPGSVCLEECVAACAEDDADCRSRCAAACPAALGEPVQILARNSDEIADPLRPGLPPVSDPRAVTALKSYLPFIAGRGAAAAEGGTQGLAALVGGGVFNGYLPPEALRSVDELPEGDLPVSQVNEYCGTGAVNAASGFGGGVYGAAYGGASPDAAKEANLLTSSLPLPNISFFLANGDGSLVALDVDNGINLVLPAPPSYMPTRFLPPNYLAPPDALDGYVRAGMVYVEQAKLLFTANPGLDNVLAVRLGTSGEGTAQGVRFASSVTPLYAGGALDEPIDIAPQQPSPESGSVMVGSGDLYVANRGSGLIVRMTQSGEYVGSATPVVEGRPLGAGQLAGIAVSPDGSTLYITVSDGCGGDNRPGGCVYSLPVF